MIPRYQPGGFPNKAHKAVLSAITPSCQRHPTTMPALCGRGFSIIESVVVLAVLVSLISLGACYLRANLDNTLNQATASHLKKIDQAVTHYVKEHYTQFPDKPSELAIKQLVEAGYLPKDMVENNHYQQAYKMQIFPKEQGERKLLQVVITTQGGQEISETAMRKISDLVGGQAGYVSILSPDKITGSQGGWSMDNGNTEDDKRLAPVGHLASVSLINQYDVIDADGLLRRRKIDGHPQYNTMETDLQMQANVIEYENGEFKGKISSNQLLFSHEQQAIEISLANGPLIQIKNGGRTVNLNSQQLSFGEVAFEAKKTAGSWMLPSKVDGNWNQIPFYEREQDDTASIWKFADERCEKRHEKDFPQGRMFLLGRKNNREDAGLFICGTPTAENDGYGKNDQYHATDPEKLNARAYLIAKAGRKHDFRTLKPGRKILQGFGLPKRDFVSCAFGCLPALLYMPGLILMYEDNSNISRWVFSLVNETIPTYYGDLSLEENQKKYMTEYANWTIPDELKKFYKLASSDDLRHIYEKISESRPDECDEIIRYLEEIRKQRGEDFVPVLKYRTEGVIFPDNPW